MHVRVRHLAPVRLVPGRGWRERLVLAPCETDATIPTAHRDEFVPLGVGGYQCDGYLRSGEVWTDLPIVRHREQGKVFGDWLSGLETGSIDESAIRQTLERTPFATASHSILFDRNLADGEAVDGVVDGARELRRDLRAPCAAGVRKALGSDFAIVGDKVMRRANPLVQVDCISKPPLFQVTLQPNKWMSAMLMFRIERIGLARRHYGLDDMAGCLGLRSLLDATGGSPPPADDRSIFVNAYADTVYESVQAALRKHPDEPLVRLHEARLQPLVDMALCGLVDAAAMPEAVGTIRAAALDVSPFLPRGRKDGFVREIARFAEEVLTPPEDLDPGDVAVLNHLAHR